MTSLNPTLKTLLGGGLTAATLVYASAALASPQRPTAPLAPGNNRIGQIYESTYESVPPLYLRLDATASIAPIEGNISTTLVNDSPSVITYQVVGGTEPTELAPGESAELTGLQVPTHIRYYQKDGGLTRAELSDVLPGEESLTVTLTQAQSYDEDTGSMVVTDTGGVYFH